MEENKDVELTPDLEESREISEEDKEQTTCESGE